MSYIVHYLKQDKLTPETMNTLTVPQLNDMLVGCEKELVTLYTQAEQAKELYEKLNHQCSMLQKNMKVINAALHYTSFYMPNSEKRGTK